MSRCGQRTDPTAGMGVRPLSLLCQLQSPSGRRQTRDLTQKKP